MASRNAHIFFGIIIAVGIYFIVTKYIKKKSPTLEGVVLSVVAGGLIALLPDIIEPPLNPNHRGFLHSLTLLAIMFYGNKKALENFNLDPDLKIVITVLSGGLISHLALDAFTPKSLPLIK